MNETHLTNPVSTVKACWSCHGPIYVGTLFCLTCKAVQGPAAVDHFKRLGLKVHFGISHSVLDRVYFDLQRQLHPDRFAQKSPREKTLSQQQAIALNDAYETLKDDLLRADYMIHLYSNEPLAKTGNSVNDQAVLMEALQMREHLAAIETMNDLNVLAKKTKYDMENVVGQLADAFESKDINAAAQLTTRLKYLHKMIDEVRHVSTRLRA